MTVTLPKTIADYFAADSRDGAAVARCFTPDALVVDEKRNHVGREAIARWKTDSSAKYNYVSEPFAIANEGDRIVVSAHLTGNFPGSPVDLRYGFTLAGDLISRLEIVP